MERRPPEAVLPGEELNCPPGALHPGGVQSYIPARVRTSVRRTR